MTHERSLEHLDNGTDLKRVIVHRYVRGRSYSITLPATVADDASDGDEQPTTDRKTDP